MTRATPNKLTLDLMLRVVDYVRANYAHSQLSEREFAAKAGEELGFPICVSNINSARQALSIPPNKTVKSRQIQAAKAARKAEVPERGVNLILDELHALNKQVANLTAAINTLLKAVGQR